MRALIVEDHVLFADAIRPTLEAAGISVVAVVTRGAHALPAVRTHRPDMVLVDLGLPDESGLVVGRTILDEAPGTKVLALTALEDGRTVKQALQLGFSGYVSKDVPVARFVTAILDAAGGEVVVPVLANGDRRARGNGSREGAAFLADQLTERERDVLALLVEGESGPTIARRLNITPNTVRTHVQSILTKLQVHSRLEAATFAVRHGIVEASRRRPA